MHGAARTASRVLAVRSLYHELALYPKPGLVSFSDNGAHRDMNVGTFVRSLFSLRGYFVAIAEAGMRDAGFAELQQLGIAAEIAHAARHARHQHAPWCDLHARHARRCGRLRGSAQHRAIRRESARDRDG